MILFFMLFMQQIFMEYLLCARLSFTHLFNKDLLSSCQVHTVPSTVLILKGNLDYNKGVMWFLFYKTPSPLLL